MAKIIIGHAGSKKIGFDLDTLLVTNLLIQANSGAGKSYLLRKLMEEMFGHVQVIAIDPEGEFATLREKFDYVLVGKGGETPAHVSTATELALKLLELRASAVCDLYEMPARERHTWVAKFLSALIDAPKKLWHPLIVIVDEAHLFCPEEGDSEAAEAMIDLATRGRKRGFCPVWATQRLAKLEKDAAAELKNKLIGGTFLDVDIKRAAVDLGLPTSGKDFRDFSSHMKVIAPGTFIALGRAISKERIELKVGEVQTSHPKPGSSKHAAEPPAPSAKVRELLTKLAELPQIAEEKARTVDDYKRQVRDLKNELAAARKAKPAEAPSGDIRGLRAKFAALVKKNSALKASLEEVMKIAAKVNALGFEGLAIKPEEVKLIFDEAAKQIGKMAEKKIQQRNSEIAELKKDMARVQRRLSSLLSEEEEKIDISLDVQRQEPFKLRDTSLQNGNSVPALKIEGLTSSQATILRALAEFESLGRHSVDKKWVAALAGVRYTSSNFTNNLGALRSDGFIDYPQQGFAALTESGRSSVPEVDAPSSAQEMLERCKRIISSSQACILQVLADAYPAALEKTVVAEKAGASPTSSNFTNNLGALRSAGLIEYPRQGEARISSWVMLEE